VAAADDGPFAGRYTPMLGYWNAPEATAEALAGGVLHTGDVGTVSPAGEVVVHDRRKLVILRGGANVYPAEVERVIQPVPGVVAVSVIGVPDPRLGQRVAALVQVAGPDAVDATTLADRCRAELARYKVPEVWHLTPEPLPRNAMGKIDRPRLTELLNREG
jgi:acyl-CoA synthetase (AMP-forming)/AMP-acid ligase II